jgi:muramoyltetrapeptide carboxypeptidase LdcA involved in peptidoglycan recycling
MKKLKQGDTIGIFSPSTPITALCPIRYQRGKSFLESKGFIVKEGKLTGHKDGYRSGSIKERAEELNELIRDSKVRCIMSTIGGMNSNALLPYIDYDALKKDPKIIIGYSDVTAVLFAIHSITDLPTFYGPACVASFGELTPYNDMHYKYFEDVCMKPLTTYTYQKPEIWTDEYIDWSTQTRSKKGYKNNWLTLHPGQVEGRLIVGNLNTLSGIMGSPYMIEIKKGDILFIEDSLKNGATVERSFNMLKLNGIFDKIGGLIIGKHELYDQNSKPHLEILKEVVGEFNYPVLAEVDCSHTQPMFTMEIGATINLDADNQLITLLSHFGQENKTK